VVKQIPRFEEMRLDADGRLSREGELEMNPYCRRAVAKGVELARASGGECVAFTLGPPRAEAVLREAVAWGAHRGVLVTDPAFAGSDTLATALALSAALEREGQWDLVLAGRNAVDADTGQVGPEIAQLLDRPFVAGVKKLGVHDHTITALCELDDGWMRIQASMPAVVSCAERLCEPCKAPPGQCAAVDADRIMTLSARDLGAGPWGQAASPTAVGRVQTLAVDRAGVQMSGPLAEQATAVVRTLVDRGAPLRASAAVETPRLPAARPVSGRAVGVILEPDRLRASRELLGAAAELAEAIGGHVVALAFDTADPIELCRAGADALVYVAEAEIEEDAAAMVGAWVEEEQPWALLTAGTLWGREVAARVAAHSRSGLTGDAVDLSIENDRLVAWKPAFGGWLVAAVTSSSSVQMVTVRPGMLAVPEPRTAPDVSVAHRTASPRRRIRRLDGERDDELDSLATATVVIGVGTGVSPDDYGSLAELCSVLHAELGATRKVTDNGWLPRSRQIGITGRSIRPELYVAIGISGKFNHMVGVRGAGVIVAVNRDATAPIFDAADIGIVGDWHDVVPELTRAIKRARSTTA
jgi:electron transfer flavoprotein alpha subunit